MRRAMVILGRELGAAGLARVWVPGDATRFVWRQDPGGHHMGATRMGRDPAVSVVDADMLRRTRCGTCMSQGAPSSRPAATRTPRSRWWRWLTGSRTRSGRQRGAGRFRRMTTIPRRDFLCQALVGHALVGRSSRRVRWLMDWSGDGVRSRGVGRAPRYFGGRADAVRAIGEAYLRQLGRDPNSRVDPRGRARGPRCPSTARATSVSAIQYARSGGAERLRIVDAPVQLEGWILSRTEAEICALTLLAAEA